MLPSDKQQLTSPRGVLLLLAFVLFVTYGWTLSNPFVWDDRYLIVNNPRLTQPLTAFFSPLYPGFEPGIPISEYYRPLQTVSYSLDYRMWGLNPLGYHLVNLILHWFNACLIYCLIKSVCDRSLSAFLGSLFFAIHPIFTTSVTYVSGRADLLLLFFVLLSLELFRRFLKSRRVVHYAMSLLSFLLACFSKESALLFLPCLLLIVLFYRKEQERLAWLHWVGSLAVFLFYASIRTHVVHMTPLSSWPPSFLPTAVKTTFLYVLLFLCPSNPHLGRTVAPSASFLEPVTGISLLFLFSSLLLIYYLYKRVNLFSFGLLWYLSWIIPLAIFNAAFLRLGSGEEVLMPENNLYVASVGLACLLGALGESLVRTSRGKWVTIAAVGAYALFLLVGTVSANRLWADEVSFYENTLRWAKDPAYTHSLHEMLGLAYKREGDLENAIRHYDIALTIRKNPVVFHNLGNVYLEKEELVKAREQYLEAVRLDPSFAPAYIGLGHVSSREGKTEEAAEWFRRAADLNGAQR